MGFHFTFKLRNSEWYYVICNCCIYYRTSALENRLQETARTQPRKHERGQEGEAEEKPNPGSEEHRAQILHLEEVLQIDSGVPIICRSYHMMSVYIHTSG